MRAAVLCLAVAGCYSPEARDCTVSCTAAADCINGQVCGTDHFCAAPDVAGHCSAVDAAVIRPDGKKDGDKPDAAPADITLTINIMGHGKVQVDTLTTCDSNCMVSAPAGVVRTLTAIPDDSDKPFQMWSMACTGPMPTCTLTPTTNLTIGAKFP